MSTDSPTAPQAASAAAISGVSRLSRPGVHMAVVSLGIFLAALDQTVVVTALPAIANDLNIGPTQLDRAAWVVTAYLLGYTVALPLMGRVADVFGQRRIYLFSLGLFLFGSALCALSQSLEMLIAARAIQAVGGGAILPVGMAMARHLYGTRRVPFVLGILGAVAEAGGVLGPLWGTIVIKNMDGWLGYKGWHWIFWVNIPLGLLFGALVFRTRLLPRFPGRVDWAGALLLAGGLLALSLALSTPGSVGAWVGLDPTKQQNNGDWLTPQGLLLLFVSLALFAFFVWWQRRQQSRPASDPLVPLELFARRNWPYSAASLTNMFVGAALIITMVNIPLYVASVLDGTPEQGGLMLLRMTAFIPLGAVLGGFLGLRTGYRWVGIAGLISAAAGFWEMSRWTVTSADDPATWLGLALNGFGFGLLISPVTATALSWGGLERAALSAASVNLSRMIGMMVSLSALTAWGLRHFQSLMSGHPAPLFQAAGETAQQFAQRQADYTAYYKWASLQVYTTGFTVAAIVCLVAIIFAISLRRNPGADIEPGPIF